MNESKDERRKKAKERKQGVIGTSDILRVPISDWRFTLRPHQAHHVRPCIYKCKCRCSLSVLANEILRLIIMLALDLVLLRNLELGMIPSMLVPKMLIGFYFQVNPTV